MEFFPEKESVKDSADFLSTFERLQGTGDCIFNDLLDFPNCSLGVQPEDVFSLDSSVKAELDPWNNLKFEASQTTELRHSCDDKADGSSNGSIFTYFSAGSFPEESNYRDSILPPYEMHVSEDFHSLNMDTSTVDVLDYLEDSRSLLNLTSKSPSNYNTSWEHETLFLRSENNGDAETNCESPDEEKCCYNSASNFSPINSCNWLTDNAQLEWTSLAETQCNTCEIAEAFKNNDTAEKPEDYFECTGAGWTDWSTQSQLDEKGLISSSAKCTAASSTENTLTVTENVSLLNTSNFQASSDDCSNFWQVHENINIEEELPGEQSGSKPSLNNNNNYADPVNQRKEEENSLIGKITACPLVMASYQWQLPFSTEICTELHNFSNTCSNMATSLPVSYAACGQLDETCTINPDKCKSENSSKSENIKSSVPNSQRNRPLCDKNRAAKNEKKYMKVGKRGCFVSVPVDGVNKLMVRDLLSMSGNREEISMKDSTQEYRVNIRKMLQQKRKRLNIV